MVLSLPVNGNNGSVVGIVTAIDILKAIQEDGDGKRELNTMVANDIMTPNQ